MILNFRITKSNVFLKKKHLTLTKKKKKRFRISYIIFKQKKQHHTLKKNKFLRNLHVYDQIENDGLVEFDKSNE